MATAIGGTPLTSTVEGRERFPVRVRYARELRDNPDELKKILIPTKSGVQIPLGELVDVKYKRGPQLIKSENTFLVGYVIFDKKDTRAVYIMVELKKPKLKDGKEQLKSYCNATGAPIGIWSNGDSISYYHRKDPNYFEDLSAIPKATEKLSDILSERWTIDNLIEKDKLRTERKSLKDLILEMEDEVLANAGVDVFEELFKLIFTKLFDEMESGRNKTRHLEFRNYGDTETELKEKIQNLFDKAKNKWEGVFSDDSKIELTTSHLSVCVSSLQDVKLFILRVG